MVKNACKAAGRLLVENVFLFNNYPNEFYTFGRQIINTYALIQNGIYK